MPTHKQAPLNSFIPLSLYFHLLSISPSVGFSGPTKGFVSASWQAFGTAECTLGFIANLLPSIERAGSELAMSAPGRETTVNHSLSVLWWDWLEPVWELCTHTHTHTPTALFYQETVSILTDMGKQTLLTGLSQKKYPSTLEHHSRKRWLFSFKYLQHFKKTVRSHCVLWKMKCKGGVLIFALCAMCCSYWASCYLTM